VTFTGAFDGRLVLAVSRGILKELAANMLGVEHASPTPEQQDDALKEMVNVVCGNLLPVLAGPQPVFHMSAPEIGPVHGAADQGERPSAATARMCVDAGAAELSLFVNDPAALEAAATAHTEKACI
jgi:CheY-specific phosphatase CheX